MSCPRPQLQFSPLPSCSVVRHPHVLLIGQHSPSLLKYLEGWPKNWAADRQSLLKFAAAQDAELREMPDAAFDLVVLGESASVLTDELLHEVLRVARQGLIRLR